MDKLSGRRRERAECRLPIATRKSRILRRSAPACRHCLTNAFSKKLENHAHAATLFYMHYKIARPHQTPKRFGRPTRPAMAAGVADYPWSLTQIAELLD